MPLRARGRAFSEAMYDMATEDMYNFVYINLLANTVDEMFYWDFIRRLIPSHLED